MMPLEKLLSRLEQCQAHINTLQDVSTNRKTVVHWFNTLCHHLTDIILTLKTLRRQNPSVAPIQTTLLLYLTQILTCLALQISVFLQEEKLGAVLFGVRNCVTRQLRCCLSSFAATLGTRQAPEDPVGNFVNWMDTALDSITKVTPQNKDASEARHLFEEVLSHAMSIAQIALDDDKKIIPGSCQSVLAAFRSLEEEIGKVEPNGAVVKLYVDASSDKLCALERKVNSAVLKLCLYTFSRFDEPLLLIRDFCFDTNNKTKIEDLDGLVADFDLHVDRIMQIGLFAMSCSSDSARGIKIRSCLASLEALETELVPVFTSALVDNSVHNVNCAIILMKHWLSQAVRLQHLIYLIIDPFAFCRIIHEEIIEIIKKFDQPLKQNSIDNLIKIAKVMQVFLSKSQTEFSEQEKEKVGKHLTDFNNIVKEVECSSYKLLNSEDGAKRVLKRCKILETVVKRLWYCFADVTPTLSTQDSVDTVPEKVVTGNGFLDHIINRGKQILQDRSILYKTPVKEAPFFKNIHFRNLSFLGSSKNETIDLHITDILNEMSNLSQIMTE